MRRLILGFLVYLIFFNSSALFAEDNIIMHKPEPQIVRVGISDNNFSNYLFDRVSVSSNSSFIISDNFEKEILLEPYKTADITFKDGQFEVCDGNNVILKTDKKLVISSTNIGVLYINGLKRKSKQAFYKGNIELEISLSNPLNKFAIVNVLPLQDYLKGVVPNEMPVSFGLEALKAQAILARNYLLKPREKYYKEFDICDSVACQVYFGANTQEPLSDKAVDETQNLVVLYDNDLILAVYSSTSGGYTESYKNVFMKNMQGRIMSPNVPYLTAVPDDKETPKLDTEEKVREFYSYSPETFDNKSPYFRWKIEWDISDLEKILAKTITSQNIRGFIKTKYEVNYNDPNYFGHLKSVFINKRGESGKVIALTLITDKNEFTVYKELSIRKVFLYNNKILPSANVYFDIKDNKLTATGGGLGHGVGMSQWGAGAMAKKGYKFFDIIHHYYKDVKISVLPFNVYPHKPLAVEFFTESKKSDLKFENKVHIKELNIIINNKQLNDEMKKKLIKDGGINISHYIKKGKNFIIFELYGDKNVNGVKFWIESEE